MTTRKRGHQPLRHFRPSVYKTKDGVWHGRLVVGFNPGGSYNRPHRQAPSEKEVRQKLRELADKRDRGYAWSSADLTFGAWLEHYIRVHRQPKTYRGYRSAVTCHLLPAIGELRLADVEDTDLERVDKFMYSDGQRPDPGGHRGRPVPD